VNLSCDFQDCHRLDWSCEPETRSTVTAHDDQNDAPHNLQGIISKSPVAQRPAGEIVLHLVRTAAPFATGLRSFTWLMA
jgi:hypothetical protein